MVNDEAIERIEQVEARTGCCRRPKTEPLLRAVPI